MARKYVAARYELFVVVVVFVFVFVVVVVVVVVAPPPPLFIHCSSGSNVCVRSTIFVFFGVGWG